MAKAMITPETFDFIQNVNRADIPRQIAGMLFAEAEQLGFTGLSMGWLPPKNSSALSKFELVSLPEEYFQRYSQRRYDRHSAIVRHMGVTADPFRWDKVSIDDSAQPLAKKILNEARDFGLLSGWCIPVHKSSQVSGFIMVSASCDIKASPDLAQFHLMTLCAYFRILELRSPTERFLINATECQIMAFLAKGKTAEDISKIFSISSRTVEWHLANAGLKLGTSNSAHTVIEAIRLKIISI